jgi:predicted Rossmann fold flavoprotein
MSIKNNNYEVIVIGAGAAGLMAAYIAASRGKKVLLIEHSNKIGEKIRISGGGRCNFTNLNTTSSNYLSNNPHYIKSALAGFTQHDFIKLIERHSIYYHEKTLGQLFCDGSSTQIINMFLKLCNNYQVDIKTNCIVTEVSKSDFFNVISNQGKFLARSLIIATGGLSIPKIGASDFGYRIAKQFGLKIIPPRPALVPLTVAEPQRQLFTTLSGISNYSSVTYKNTKFLENILFTHKGLSGPAILQISSYLTRFNGEEITINLLPKINLREELINNKHNKILLSNFLKNYLPNRFIELLATNWKLDSFLADVKNNYLVDFANNLHNFKVKINGNEGYQKAEVTAGGVDTRCLSSKTMECLNISGLYFIGEVVDVTGWLGGYNFQWAWSSGYAAGINC